jgi:hypothetical protein
MKTFKQHSNVLLEMGLSRMRTHFQNGPVGIVSAFQGKDRNEDEDNHKKLIGMAREHGYGPIQTTGRSQWGPEKSVVIPGVSKEHLEKFGNHFNQQAAIHVTDGGTKANLHWLKSSDKPGVTEHLGGVHYNKPNDLGVTILKGHGFNTKDKTSIGAEKTDGERPTRSFTFGEGYILEKIEIPPSGMLRQEAIPLV